MRKDNEIYEELMRIQDLLGITGLKMAELMDISPALFSHKKKYRNGNYFNDEEFKLFTNNLSKT